MSDVPSRWRACSFLALSLARPYDYKISQYFYFFGLCVFVRPSPYFFFRGEAGKWDEMLDGRGGKTEGSGATAPPLCGFGVVEFKLQ